MKTHQPIALRFWVESGVNSLCVGWTHVFGVKSFRWSSLERRNSGIRVKCLCGDWLRRNHVSNSV